MTAETSASTAARKGARSTASRCSRSAGTSASPWWESVPVPPCPGKCFAVASAPPASTPRRNATPSSATRPGSAPKERVPITALEALRRTSSTGASTRWTPTARASRATMRPWRSSAAGSGAAPDCIAGGKRTPPAVRIGVPHS